MGNGGFMGFSWDLSSGKLRVCKLETDRMIAMYIGSFRLVVSKGIYFLAVPNRIQTWNAT